MAYDVEPEARRRYVEEISGQFRLGFVPVDEPREPVGGCYSGVKGAHSQGTARDDQAGLVG
jgi:hypothetical protein